MVTSVRVRVAEAFLVGLRPWLGASSRAESTVTRADGDPESRCDLSLPSLLTACCVLWHARRYAHHWAGPLTAEPRSSGFSRTGARPLLCARPDGAVRMRAARGAERGRASFTTSRPTSGNFIRARNRLWRLEIKPSPAGGGVCMPQRRASGCRAVEQSRRVVGVLRVAVLRPIGRLRVGTLLGVACR